MDELEQQFPDVHAGLENAIEMAEEEDGTEGFALINQEGQLKVMTQAAANLAQKGETGADAVLENIPTQQRALREYKDRAEIGIRRPQIA